MPNKIFFIILILTVFLTDLKAQNNSSQVIKGGNHTAITKPNLNGHNFIGTSQFKTPFINTALNAVMSAGQAVGFELPPIKIDTFTLTRDRGSILVTNIDFEYEAMLRDWLSFNISYQIEGRAGTKTSPLIAQGVNLASGYKIGMTFKLWERKNMLLSGSVDVINKSYTVIDIEDFITKVIQNGGLTQENTLSKTVPSLSVLGGARYAWALNPSFGILGSAEFGFGESIDKTKDDRFLFNGGFLLEYDLLPKSKVPLGFGVGFYQNSFPVLSQDRIGNPHIFLGQIAYTGRNDLGAGIEFTYEFSTPESYNTGGNAVKFLTVYGNLKYYF
ncbi:MAG: hypothetical protein JSS91_08955 [Bacteroidetes bacterium]|nr:hypothetical protein [Bacteroidota bacterium]